MIEKEILRDYLVDIFGIDLQVDTEMLPNKHVIRVRPTDFARNHGFVIYSELSWLSLSTRFELESFSAELLGQLSASDNIKKQTFFELIKKKLEDKNTVLMLHINGSGVSMLDPSVNWKSILLSIEQSPIKLDVKDENQYIIEQVRFVLGAILVLLELEEKPDNSDAEVLGLPEGDRIQVLITRFERSRVNRQACIEFYGTSCLACGFDFEVKYGFIGRGFIHVHHKKPISELGKGYIVDPINDLVPLCPNCHAMIHQTNPPIELSELKRIIMIDRTNGQR